MLSRTNFPRLQCNLIFTNMKYLFIAEIFLILATFTNSEDPQTYPVDIEYEPSLSGSPVAHLKNGILRGKILNTPSGKKIYSYLGIRYAHPPTGTRRFKAPEELLEPWEGVKNAYFDGNKCPQLTFPERKFEGDEDCLFLNVYSSKIFEAEDVNQEKLSVFVFLHGGGFSHGSGLSEEYGPQHLLEHDMILVVPNYRIGPFGFLTMGNGDLPLNLGLLDQQMALKWVQRNIAAFGGDPNKVTLGGSNAGAVSTHIHALTPSSHAISGNALTSWGTVELNEAKERALKLVDLLDCKRNVKDKNKSADPSTAAILSCLSSADMDKIMWRAQFTIDLNTDFTFPFVPVIDSNNKEAIFLQQHPEELMSSSSLADIPWMMGVTSHEGLPHSLQVMVAPWVAEAFSENFEENVPIFLGLQAKSRENLKEAGKRIREFYSLNRGIGFGAIKDLAELFSDAFYFTTLMKTVKGYALKNESPLYIYHFSYNYRKSKLAVGVPQGDDVGYLFPGNNTLHTFEPNTEEEEIAKRITRLVASFVSSNKPTDAEAENFSWISASKEEVSFLDIGRNYSILKGSDFHPKRLHLWEEIDRILQKEISQDKKDEL
ncbi:hypothetical protein J437_LFUL015231 [Ladona fulva]|uniref:Carboxylesterase type B domain-containing protein n=1 Tax=Ladona fulva TaxID=123851 RepID=A0A8K0KLA3_LADFU|nr:hypothetical protein J437_LFUL015231 [Ladona fulva]